MCVCVCVFVCVGRFRFRSRSRFLFTAIVVIDQRRVVVDASSRRVFSFQFCAGGVAFGHRQMMNLFVCFFFFFFNNKKKRSIVVSMADRWRILATRNGKPLLFVFVLFPFFFVYCWSEPSPSTVIIESNGRAVKSRGVARNAAPPLDGHRRRRRRPRRRSIADRISSSFIVSGFRQSERERERER